MKILMVCLGNICRSPLAQGVLEHFVQLRGLNWQIDSAGTNGIHVGEPPHHLSIQVAKENGIEIKNQRCRKFVKNDMLLFDKIYVMDDENYKAIELICGKEFNFLKVDYILNEVHPNQNKAVPDPWYGGIDGYYNVFKMLYAASESIVNKHQP